jgi:hypothetical protein
MTTYGDRRPFLHTETGSSAWIAASVIAASVIATQGNDGEEDLRLEPQLETNRADAMSQHF